MIPISLHFISSSTLISTCNSAGCLCFTFIFLKFIYLLFMFGCTGSLLLRAGFLYLWRAGPILHCSVQASHCSGFSCCGAWDLDLWASVVVARRLSSCGTQAQ